MDKALYDKGMAMRRKVLGDDYVDRAIANTDDFNRQFQELLTTYCWGAVWGDEALKPRDRSILNLGMIACLGRMHEFEAHFRGALRNGLTPAELSAILRQIAVYCGFPAAVDAHRIAKQVLAAEAKGAWAARTGGAFGAARARKAGPSPGNHDTEIVRFWS